MNYELYNHKTISLFKGDELMLSLFKDNELMLSPFKGDLLMLRSFKGDELMRNEFYDEIHCENPTNLITLRHDELK